MFPTMPRPAPALYTIEGGFDRAAIMRAAWADVHSHIEFHRTVAEMTKKPLNLRKPFASALKDAWKIAKGQRITAERAAAWEIEKPAVLEARRAERVERERKHEEAKAREAAAWAALTDAERQASNDRLAAEIRAIGTLQQPRRRVA